MTKKNELIKIYRDVLNKLIEDFKNSKGKSSKEIKGTIINNLNNAFKEAKKTRGELQQELISMYANEKLKALNIAKYTGFYKIDSSEIEKLYMLLNKRLVRAEKGLGRQIKSFFDNEQTKITKVFNKNLSEVTIKRELGLNKKEAINELIIKLKNNSYFKFVDKNNKVLKMRIDSYAKLNINSIIQQSKNTATIDAMKDTKNNLVIFSKHFWTCESCAKYAEGRVYTIDRRNKKYPYLYDLIGFNKGYNSLHPNCKHRLSGYFEEGKTKEELKKIRKYSKLHTDVRNKSDIEKYLLKQKLNILNARKRYLISEIKIKPKDIKLKKRLQKLNIQILKNNKLFKEA